MGAIATPRESGSGTPRAWRVRLLVSTAVVIVVVLGGNGTAGAHGGQGAERPPASNFRSEITSVSPTVEGVSVSVVDAGSRLELTNDSDVDVVVRGYDGDPYLRVGPDGVFENSHSASAYLNAERYGRTQIPIVANSDAEPVWRRLSSDRAVRWHDHRAHWMNDTPPASVLADPERSTQLVGEWAVLLSVDGEEVTVSGTLGWVEPPSPLWWWFGAICAAAVMLSAARRWRGVAPMLGSAVLFVATMLNAAGAWAATPGGTVVRVAALTLPVMMWSLLGAGAVLFRRDRVDALLLIGAAAAGLAAVFGFTDLGWLSSAVIPSALPGVLARVTVALAMGVGSGLAVYAALDAGPALVERRAARRVAAEEASAERGSTVRPVAFGRRHRWVLVPPIVAIVIGIGILSSPDDTSVVADPTLVRDVCAATSGTRALDDQLHVGLHQLVASVADGDAVVAQRLSDSVDASGADTLDAGDAEELRDAVDVALSATGQEPLECDPS